MIETLALVRSEGGATYYYVAATFLLAYLAGSIPFGPIFAWLGGAGDLRRIGSGNIGATNVLRTGHKWAAAATLICDIAKGAAAVIIADRYFGIQLFPVVAAFGAFIGHLFPFWLRFKGGKGVATFIGICLGLDLFVGFLTCMTWLAAASMFRISSLAALIAVIAAPLYFLLLGSTLFAGLTALLAGAIIITHRGNISRLIGGGEPRIGH